MIWLIPSEPLDYRWTKQWYTTIPDNLGSSPYTIVDGTSIYESNDDFVDLFHSTPYQASQSIAIAQLFYEGKIKDGDRFLFYEALCDTPFAVRTLAKLNEIEVELHAIWHVGSYDSTYLFADSDWNRYRELALYKCIDYNYFATFHHISTFKTGLNISGDNYKIYRVGQPHEQLVRDCKKANKRNNKRDLVVFPHRLQNDKRPDIFRAMQSKLHEAGIETIITHEHRFPKEDYYNVLGQAKVVVSCAEHENLGIAQAEGVFCGAIPFVPDRHAYDEMYPYPYKYDPYRYGSDQLAQQVIDLVNSYEYHKARYTSSHLEQQYFSATLMYDNLTRKY